MDLQTKIKRFVNVVQNNKPKKSFDIIHDYFKYRLFGKYKSRFRILKQTYGEKIAEINQDSNQNNKTSEDNIIFCVIGDLEPKNGVYKHFENAVTELNKLDNEFELDFVASVGDLVHRGKKAHYKSLDNLIQKLKPEFYPIIGNEEIGGGTELFLNYLNKWNRTQDFKDMSYTLEFEDLRFIFASAGNNGSNLSSKEINWIKSNLNDNKPSVLFLHSPINPSFPRSQKGSKSSRFNCILEQENLILVFSGHSHMDLDTNTTFIKDKFGTNHVHVPGVERTKIGKRHVPRFRFVHINTNGVIEIKSYNLFDKSFEENNKIKIIFDF